jgi:alginate O-acetyltransferase complex protein AlgI
LVFSSIAFLCLFFPTVFFAYHALPDRWKNPFLAFASILFYAWGEPRFVILMLLSVAFNFRCALAMERATTPARRQSLLLAAVAVNLLLLTVFKYTGFLIDNVNALLHLGGQPGQLAVPHIALPIGISFYTFHAISYLIDIYRRNVRPNDSLVEYSLYIMLFPQLVAGPIIRYKDIHTQLHTRSVSMADLQEGVYRFVLGLSKKVLIANPLALIADNGFDSPASDLTTGGAWLCLAAYTLQIYFDFSGYSDMAIGLARMFGFRFPENFNYPYTARSIQDFWRRWHISLSTWFRDYVYIPLGGNRLGSIRTLVNLWIVFLLTGIWHGASWNFLIWGAIHGFFLMTERLLADSALGRLRVPAMLQHLYTMGVVMLAWVFFRVDGLADALAFIRVLFGQSAAGATAQPYDATQALHIGLLLGVALVLAGGAYAALRDRWGARLYTRMEALAIDGILRTFVALPLLALCMMMLALGQYSPFIYFRF